jgi:non-specific serine/threonine protein kinase
MLQIPLAFKGPAKQIESLFPEEMVYQAIQIIVADNLIHWQHDELLETVNGVIEDKGRLHKLSINWPIDSDVALGTCPCEKSVPCVHLCAMVIESKARIDQLPPFTGQLQANRNIQQTLATWINQQIHDPYPNMARHRLVYFLDTDENEKNFTISLHKAYLSKDERYATKAKLDSSLLQQKPLPKFVSLTDKIILNRLQRNNIIKQHSFQLINKRDDDLLKNILQTGRCFWKNCYRPALQFDTSAQITNKMVKILDSAYILIYQNLVVFKSKQSAPKTTVRINPSQTITPKLLIQTDEISIPLAYEKIISLDIGKISFSQGQIDFSFEDLSTGKVAADSELIDRLAGFLRQIEKLDSLQAHYELALLDNYHINDRYFGGNLSTYATLICALKEEGWTIEIDDNFRLNQIKADQWYAELKSEEDNNWFDLELGIRIDGNTVNILPFLVKAIKSGNWQPNDNEDFSLKLSDGTNVSIEHNSIKQILSTLSELYDDKSLNNQEGLTLANSQIIRLNQLQKSLNKNDADKEIQWQGDTWLQDKANELAGTIGLQLISPPKNLKVTLRDYQITGLSWLQFLSQHTLGGILADDMGLGKTLQVLAHLLTEKNNGKLKSPSLIVVPTSLLSNWQSEIQKFTPDLSCLLLVGSNRHKLYDNLNNFDIAITSYGIMSRDIEILSKTDFHLLILDEAQTIKNAKTRAAQSASKIPAKHRLCLSGTPIENHLGELWSLFNFLMPGFLGQQKQFEHIYQFPIEKEKNQQRQMDLSQRVSAFMLRRTKGEVAKELPEKTEIVQLIELGEAQANIYETVRMTMSDEIKQAFERTQGSANKIIIGNALLRLRQICCHPALLKIESIDTSYESAKLNWLSTVLPNMIEEGRKILLFSSFTSMLDIIAEHLKVMNIETLMLTGKTPAAKRGALIQNFQEGDVPVFLISLKAGGAGINLTSADTVIHFDPWWNPAAEAQASDRAHRIGQDKNVFVYKLITKGTVEQRIQKMQKHKDALAKSIFDGQGNISTVLNDSHWQDFLKPIS